jgi:hypothetical protein
MIKQRDLVKLQADNNSFGLEGKLILYAWLMDLLFNRLSKLLGQPNSHSLLDGLGNEIHDMPVIVGDEDFVHNHFFPEHGFAVYCTGDSIEAVTFYISNDLAPALTKPYCGDLPGEILTTDNRQIVNKKLGATICSKTQPGEIWDDYHCDTFKITFIFDSFTNLLSWSFIRRFGDIDELMPCR